MSINATSVVKSNLPRLEVSLTSGMVKGNKAQIFNIFQHSKPRAWIELDPSSDILTIQRLDLDVLPAYEEMGSRLPPFSTS
jgi:hypothetical protein